jgi:hypothetical protein
MPKRGTKTGPKAAEIAERRQKALALRLQRWSYPKIARVLKVSIGTAFGDVDAAIKDIPREEADRLREVEMHSLDEVESRLWRRFEAGDTSAADKILKVKERRARMLGLDAPAKMEFEGEPVRVVMEYVKVNGDGNPDS